MLINYADLKPPFPLTHNGKVVYYAKELKMNKTIRINDEFEEFDTRSIDDKKRLTLGELAANYDRV
jgi:hypothetical protein